MRSKIYNQFKLDQPHLEQSGVGLPLLHNGRHADHGHDDAEQEVEDDEELVQPAVPGLEPGVERPAKDGQGYDEGEEERGHGQQGVEPVGVVGGVVLLVPRLSPATETKNRLCL